MFFFVPAMAGRTVLNVSFVERPLFLGFVWWLVTGQFSPAIPLAVFFELFWIDRIPVGGYIPPMPAFPYLLLLSLAGIFGWTEAQSLTFPLLACLPLAYMIPLLEGRQRKIQQASYSSLLAHIHKEEGRQTAPGRLIAVSVAQLLFFAALLFLLTWLGLFLLFSLPPVRNQLSFPLSVNWAVLYAIAAVGSFLALRIKQAYVLFALGMAAVAFLRLGI